MTKKAKVIVALMSALIGVALVFSVMYWFTIGHTERTKERLVEQAKTRLEAEEPELRLTEGDLFNGTNAYVTFLEEGEKVFWFVPLNKEKKIERRDTGDVTADQVCAQSLQETGGTLVSCKYGFDERALIEVVAKEGTSYTYSYYTLQTGEFIRRVQLTDSM